MKQEVKRELREYSKKRRDSILESDLKIFNSKITEKILKLDEFLTCDVILSYVSFGSEVDTNAIICAALSLKKQVAVPKIIKQGMMEFYFITKLEELQVGKFGILEPITEEIFCNTQQRVIILIPGLSFDKKGNRLGYGGGYYDRYLERMLETNHNVKKTNYNITETNHNITKIGLAFDCQIAEEIPVQPHDQKMDIIVSQSKVWRMEL